MDICIFSARSGQIHLHRKTYYHEQKNVVNRCHNDHISILVVHFNTDKNGKPDESLYLRL